MSVAIADWLSVPAFACLLAAFGCLRTGRRSQADVLFASGCGMACLGAALYGQWLGVVLNGLAVLLFARDWWKRRKRRRNVLKLAGYKARAALAKLAQRAREAAKPRPVLRPVPQGGAA